MSTKTVSAVIGSFLVAGFALGAVQGCGSSSSSGDSKTLCEQSCVKIQMCLADASASSAMTNCAATCSGGAAGSSGQTVTCSNQSAIDSAYQNCLSMSDCTKFEACIFGLPQCQTSTGTGGTTGAAGAHGTGGATGAAGAHGTGGSTATGGTSGAAGASGSASCSICDKAATCCTAIGGPATQCNMLSTASCNAATGTNQTSLISACQQVLSGGAALSPACQ